MRFGPLFLVISLVILVSLPFSLVQAAYQVNISLPEAISQGQASAWGEPLGVAFTQPMIRLHVKDETGSGLAVSLPAGTILAPPAAAFAPLVVCSASDLQVSGEIMLDINTFSLAHQLSFPSAMGNQQYPVEGLVDQAVIDLLNSVSSAGYCARYGAQLAVWSLAEGLSLDQISQAMGKIDPADLSLAEQLLGLTPSQPEAVELTPTLESITQEATLPAEEQDQIPNDSPIATSPPEAAAGVAISPGLLIGLVLGAVVLIAIAVTAVLTLREGKRRSPPPVQVESWDATPHKPVSPPPSAARQPLPAPVSTTAPIKPVLETGKRPATQIIEPGGIRLRLIGQSGKLAGRTFELQPPCLISRSPLQVFALEDPSLSTPHALFDAASNPPAVKDLSSTSGVLINAERIGSGFNDLPANAVITLGNCELRLAGGKLLVGSGTAAGRSLVVSGLAVVSAAPLSVIETGSAERGISDAHATLYVREGNFRIRDLKSSNGIILNGEHLVAESTIKSGDTLRLGSTDFTVEVVQ